MTYSEVKNKCREGYLGMIPGWKGYLTWDYASDQLCFKNGDYLLNQKNLEDKIKLRTDLYYII